MSSAREAKMAIEVRGNEMKVAGSSVDIQSHSLLNGLVHDQTKALDVLKIHDAGLNLNELSIQPNGSIKINNAAFAASVQKTLTSVKGPGLFNATHTLSC
jgi:hypothetical protein